MKKIIIAAVAAIALSTQAQAGVGFSVFGHGNYAMPNVDFPAGSGLDSVDSGFGFGGGVGLHLPLGKGNVGLELDGIYMGRKFTFNGSFLGVAFESESSYHTIQIPLLLRIKAGKALNFGVGGYYSTGIGKVTTKTTMAGVTAEAEQTFDDYGFKKEDYGLVGAIGADFGSGKGAGFFIEGRFVFGLAEEVPNPASDESFKNMDLQALVGLKF